MNWSHGLCTLWKYCLQNADERFALATVVGVSTKAYYSDTVVVRQCADTGFMTQSDSANDIIHREDD